MSLLSKLRRISRESKRNMLTRADESISCRRSREEQENFRRSDEYDTQARKIIDDIPHATEEAARRGDRSCLIMAGATNFDSQYSSDHFSGLRGLLNPTAISPKVLPPDAKRVYDYCENEGLRPRIAYSPPSFDHKRKSFYNLYIEW
jgi:hypothetical protein